MEEASDTRRCVGKWGGVVMVVHESAFEIAVVMGVGSAMQGCGVLVRVKGC